jgi:hypothetical protein
MNNRCNNHRAADYAYYGDRGIRVLWNSFEEFWADMGPTWQEGLTIDREDTNGHYEKDNCRWVPQKDQVRNRRNSRMIETPWGLMNAAAAAEKAGLRYGLFIQRVQAGWPMEDLFRPKLRRGGGDYKRDARCPASPSPSATTPRDR